MQALDTDKDGKVSRDEWLTGVRRFFETMEAALAGRAFVCGPDFSIADITTLVTVDFAKWIKLAIPETCANLRRWHAEVSARPSAKA